MSSRAGMARGAKVYVAGHRGLLGSALVRGLRAAGFENLVTLAHAELDLGDAAAPQPIKEESLLSGPPEPTNRPYAIAKIAGIELCWAYNRQHGTHYLAVMPTNLYGPGGPLRPEDLSLGGKRNLAPVEDWLLDEHGPQRESLLWSSLRTSRLRERSARIRDSGKVRWGISWAGLRDQGQGYVVSVWTDGVLIRRRYSCVLMWASVQTPLFRSCSLYSSRTGKR